MSKPYTGHDKPLINEIIRLQSLSDYSVDKLCTKVGISRQTYYNLKNGKYTVGLDIYARIIEVLEIEIKLNNKVIKMLDK